MPSYKIHNVKFYNLKARSVTCLALNEECGKLALSRCDNSVEIWNIKDCAFIEKVIPSKNSIESLLWIDSRLYSCGFAGMIIEYNLSDLKIKNQYPLTGGAAWCMDLNAEKTKLAVGTEDGYINTFFIDVDNLVYERIFDKQEGRILCIKWDNTGKMIFTGSTNNLRIWNSITGHAIHRMTTSNHSDKQKTIVWCLSVTDDNTLVSGDSRGVLSFWDTASGTLIESHQSHKADIFSLAISKDRNTIFCAGVDFNIRMFSKLSKKCPDKAQWIRGVDRCFHKHDVRAMVHYKGKLFSAGMEGILAISSYPPKHLTKHPPLLPSPCVQVCKKARYILLQYANYLEIWRLGSPLEDNNNEKSDLYQLKDEPLQLLQLRAKEDETIISCAISRNGKIIVYSTDTRVRIFDFNFNDGEATLTRSETKLPFTRIQKCLFSPKSKFFLAMNSVNGATKITIFKVKKNDFILMGEFSTDQEKLRDVNLVCFSPDNKYLVCSDCESNIAIYSIAEDFDLETMKRWCLPKYHSTPTAMAIQDNTLNLIVAYSDHKVMEYNIPKRCYTEFSNDLHNFLPSDWYLWSLPVRNVTFDPNNENIIVMHDRASIFIINKEGELSLENSKVPKLENDDSREDSSHGSSNQSHIAFRVIHERKEKDKKYEYLVHLDWLNNEELVAVEVNEETLKPHIPVFRQKLFGM